MNTKDATFARVDDGQLRLILDTRKALRQGGRGWADRQRRRLTEIVEFARARSPYYRDLYTSLPERIDDPSVLPITSKKALMSRFDDWSTDREVTFDKARAFTEDPALIGERFLSKYTVATTSGTTGTPGIFVLDDGAIAVVNALALRMLTTWLGGADVVKILARGARMSMIMATGGHFASATAAARLRKGSTRRSKRMQVLSVHMPLPELVAHLNEFRPAIMAPYASVGALLATEQQAGRLHVDPVLVVLSAEGLPSGEYRRIAEAFRSKVGNSYAACECPFLSYMCAEGWLHVNADWVVLEPVDSNHRPTKPGEESHTVLISNLANRVQPILRYDLGDSVVQKPDACGCGSPLPAVRVQGRAADALVFSARSGERVAIPPLALTLLGDRPGVERFQVLQRTPTTLDVRLQVTVGANTEQVWQALQADMKRLLANRSIHDVTIERAPEPPQQSSGGKFRAIIPLVVDDLSQGRGEQ